MAPPNDYSHVIMISHGQTNLASSDQLWTLQERIKDSRMFSPVLQN